MNIFESSGLALAFLVGCAVKATLLLALTAGTAYLLRSRSAAVRHQMWALGIAGSMALPLLTLLLPSWHSTALGNAANFLRPAQAPGQGTTYPSLTSMVIDAATGSPFSGKLVPLILALWAVGVLFVMLKLLGGVARLAWISARATAIAENEWTRIVLGISKSFGITLPVRVLQCSDARSMPLTWGLDVSADGKQLAVLYGFAEHFFEVNHIALWDLDKGAMFAEFQKPGLNITGGAFVGNHYLFAAASGNQLTLWSLP